MRTPPAPRATPGSPLTTPAAPLPRPTQITPPSEAATATAGETPATGGGPTGDNETDSPAAPESADAPATGHRRHRLFDWRIRFAALSLIWGFSFLFIKVGTDGFAPLYVTFGRLLFGTLVLLAVLVVKRDRLPRGARLWGHLTVASFLLNAFPFSLFAYSELHISSTLAGICNATTPLWGMTLSLVALSEDRPTRRRLAGLGLGFVGVLIVLGAWQGFSGQDPTGTAMALVASFSYAVGWIYVRRTLADAPHSNISMAGGQLLLGTVQLGLVAPFFAATPDALPVLPLLSVLALGTLGTGLAFVVQYGLVAEIGPTTATLVTYFIPVVATAAGVLVLGEGLTWNTPVGALIVLAGAALTQRGPRKPAAARAPAPAPDQP
ncbi:EamA family transporter [Streptomyces sp. HSW2009]|uniref:DMT family transporter n=1 Tax=Streptomyces sp. HSW2009 TaxID=3142890 RepID=UPI0032EC46B7